MSTLPSNKTSYVDVPTEALLKDRTEAGTPPARNIEFELGRRVARAQIEAAEATKAAAAYAKENVRWMFCSVVVLAAASVASLVVDLLK